MIQGVDIVCLFKPEKKKTIVEACNYRRINSDDNDHDRVTAQKNEFSFFFYFYKNIIITT